MKGIDLPKLYRLAGEGAERLEEDLYKFARVYEKDYELKCFIKNEKYTVSDKVKLAKSVFPDFIKVFWELFEVLIKEGFMDKLSLVSEEFTKLVAKESGKRFDSVLFAENPEKKIVDKLRTIAGKDVVLRIDIDPNIGGGFIWQTMDGKVLNASVCGRLMQLKEELAA